MHFIVAAWLKQFRGYFLQKYFLYMTPHYYRLLWKELYDKQIKVENLNIKHACLIFASKSCKNKQKFWKKTDIDQRLEHSAPKL